MLGRRLLSPFGGLCVFALITVLVAGGLGWVTRAALKVEAAEREASARADATAKERLALWQLDSRLFPTLAVENGRPYAQYFSLYIPHPVALDERGNLNNPGRVPSPLLSAELPDWMLLHFQLDPEKGWFSPQVLPEGIADKLQMQLGDQALILNDTPTRRKLLRELREKFDVKPTHAQFITQEYADPSEGAFGVPIFSDTTNDLAKGSLPSPMPAIDHGNLMRNSSNSTTQPPPEYQAADGKFRNSRLLESDLYDRKKAAERASKEGQSSGAPIQLGNSIGRGALPANTQQSNMEKSSAAAAAPAPKSPTSPTNPTTPSTPTDDSLRTKPMLRGGNSGTALESKANPASPQTSLAPQAPQAPSGPSVMPGAAPPGMPAPAAGGGPAPARAPIPVAAKPDAKKDSDAPKPPAPAMKAMKNPENDKLAEADRLNPLERVERKRDPLQDIPGVQQFQDAIGARRQTVPNGSTAPVEKAPAVQVGPMRPQWLFAEDGSSYLVLVRSARLETKTVFQGVVLDWAHLKDVLLDEVRSTFPEAELKPVYDGEESNERQMAAIPAKLDPGAAPAPQPLGWTPLRLGLLLGWVAALVALAGIGFAGRALIDLSERRIRFVSAVTHELRTPLTSMRLYLDLLTSGMIDDETKQKEYLRTLHGESDRLNRLIENVLDFAKLEKRTIQPHIAPTKVSTILDQARSTWADRCSADGKELIVIGTVPIDQMVPTDARIVGQILSNLIDNARKYSPGAADPRIWVWAKPGEGKRIVLEVEDRGPGVPLAERATIFRPFRRGQSADTTAGGAGLGLALAKQWAEMLGGRLSYRTAEGGVGACFRLELPV